MSDELEVEQMYRDALLEDLKDENKHLKELNKKLEDANTAMLTLIHLNDQKTALMEASPEFAEEMKRLEQAAVPSSS